MNLYPRKVSNLIPLLDEALKAAHNRDLEMLAAALRNLEKSSQTIRHEIAHDVRAKRERSS